jgi:glucose-1-phosphate adenylyltransferase
VRKNMVHLLNHDFDYVLILSGDQLYRMDFRILIGQHIETGADLTIATIPVRRPEAESLGILQMDDARRITRFVEKPKEPAVQASLAIPKGMYPGLGLADTGEDLLLASMGIYVWRTSANTSFPRPSRATRSSPTSFRVTGKTWARSAPSSRPTSSWRRSCRVSTSST